MARSAWTKASIFGLAALLAATPAIADGSRNAAIADYMAAHVEPWLVDPIILGAIRRQNEEYAALDQAGIEALDLEWSMQATATEQPFVKKLLEREISAFLAAKKTAAEGMITEIIVMDARGLNVGLSDVTSDFSQGDEPKWRQTYLSGPGATFIDQPEKDESTQTLQAQASVAITDPATGKPIGAITVGINLDKL